jgi:hypothetical protein
MLRRAIRRLAPPGPAWTVFKHIVDQGSIPGVNLAKAKAVFATLTAEQLKQLASIAETVVGRTTEFAKPPKKASRVQKAKATERSISPAQKPRKYAPEGRDVKATKRALADATKSDRITATKRRVASVPRPTKSATERGRASIGALKLSFGLWRDLRKVLAAETVHLIKAGADDDATRAGFVALREEDRAALTKEARTVLKREQKRGIRTFPMNVDITEVARVLMLLYNVERGGTLSYNRRTHNQRTMLEAHAHFAAMSRTQRDVFISKACATLTDAQNSKLATISPDGQVAVALLILRQYNEKRKFDLRYDMLSSTMRRLLRGLAHALQDGSTRVTLNEVGYAMQYADELEKNWEAD